VEIGFDQKRDVTGIFLARGFELVYAAKDLGGNDRVLIFGYGNTGQTAN
jgi:release factor glutamine methyltransferase